MATEQSRALKPIDAIRAELTAPMLQSQLGAALPRHIDRDKFTRVAMTTIAQNPDLLRCQRASLFRSIMSCAQLGLMPDAVLGEAYIVSYKPQNADAPIAQLQLGYKGLLKLARQSGQISTVNTGVIHERDVFEWEDGLSPKFRVVPKLGDRGNPIAVFAIIHYKDGGFEYEVMTVEQVEAVRLAAPSRNSPAWKNSWGEMARKTVLRRLLKKAPLSTDVARQLAVDEAREERGEIYAASDEGTELIERPAELPQAKPRKPQRRSIEQLEARAEEAVEAPPADDDAPSFEGD